MPDEDRMTRREKEIAKRQAAAKGSSAHAHRPHIGRHTMLRAIHRAAANTGKRKASSIGASSRILGDKTFAAISALEGLKLGRASKERLSALREKTLIPAQKRAEVLREYIRPKGR